AAPCYNPVVDSSYSLIANHLPIEGPEYNPSPLEKANYEKAAQLYDISGNAARMIRAFLMEHPQLLDTHPELAMIASNIAGMVYKETCDLVGIPENVRLEVASHNE
ncbi:MAG TPA: hypothetical protein VJ801_18025, partial [Polyangia bacterium]|nr:hypothetical protein [Polyangia bacterium]